MKFIFTPPLEVPAIPDADLKLSREEFSKKYIIRDVKPPKRKR